MTKKYEGTCIDCGRKDEQIWECGCDVSMCIGPVQHKPEDDVE